MIPTQSFTAHRVLCVLVFSLVVFGAGCNDGEKSATEEAPPQVVMLQEGTGAPNEEPLWPLRPGTRIGEQGWVLPPVDVDGEQVIPVGMPPGKIHEYLGVPGEPSIWRWYSQDDEGNIWYRGAPREGLLDPPALLVPATVRVGMSWNTSYYPGGDVYGLPDMKACTVPAPNVPAGHSCEDYHRFSISVVDRTLRDTVYGERNVWTLEVTDWRRYTPAFAFPGWPEEEVYDGVTITMQFIEGRGPTSVPFAGTERAPDLEYGVLPLEPWMAPPPLPSITLEPRNDGEPIATQKLGRTASAYLDPAAHGDAEIAASHGVWLSYSPGGNEEISVPFWGTVAYDRCELAASGDELDEQDCRWGQGVSVSADGTRALTLDLSRGGTTLASGSDLVAGLFEDDQGAFYGIHRPMWVGEVDGDLDHAPTLIDDHDFETWPLWKRNRNGYFRFMAPFVVESDDRAVQMLELGTKLEFFAWDDIARHARAEHVAYPGNMQINVAARPGEKDVLLTTYGGRVDRVHLLDDGIELQPLGDIDVPEGQFLAGAVPVGDELIVYTQRGYAGVDPWYDRGYSDCSTCTGLNRAFPPDLGETVSWRAPLPEGGESERPDPIWGVTAVRTGLDVRVCWPPGHGSPSLDGWTLGGHAPRAVTVVGGEDRCVLLTRDLAVPDLLAAHSAWTVEGPIPGFGRVAIGQREFDVGSDSKPEDIYPIELMQRRINGGVLMRAGLVLDREMFAGDAAAYPQLRSNFELALAEVQQVPVTDVQLGQQAVHLDEAGHGQWVFDFPTNTLFLWDGESIEVFDDVDLTREDFDSSTGRWRGTKAVGGGLLFESFYLAPDGTQHPIPLGAAELIKWVRAADGTICGVMVSNSDDWTDFLRCIAPDGTQRDGPETHELNWGPVVGADGRIYLHTRGSQDTVLHIFDHDTMTVAPAADLAALGIERAPDEKLRLGDWFIDPEGVQYNVLSVRHLNYATHHLLRLGPDGLERIERPELVYFASYDGVGLVLTDEFYIFVAEGVLNPNIDESHDASWFTRPEILRVPREGDAGRPPGDFVDGATGCVPVDDYEADTLTGPQRDLAWMFRCGGETCPNVPSAAGERTLRAILCSTAILDPDTELIDEDGNRLTGKIVRQGAVRYSELKPFHTYTLRKVIDEVTVETTLRTNNAGQHFVSAALPDPAVGDLGPAPSASTSGCEIHEAFNDGVDNCFRTQFDPNRRALLVETDDIGGVLVQNDPAAPLGLDITTLPTGEGAVFSPDGRFLVGSAAAWDVELGQSVELTSDRDPARPPTFALPEHPMMFVPRLDGTGVVLEWDSDTGALTELLQTSAALEASFAGDGSSIVTREATGVPDEHEIVRYDLVSGARTVLWTGTGPAQDIVASGDGSIVFAFNGSPPPSGGETTRLRIYAIREGFNAAWHPMDILWREDQPAAFAIDRRDGGAIWIAEEPDGSWQLYRYDTTLTDPSTPSAEIFEPVPGQSWGAFEIESVQLRGDGALLVNVVPDTTSEMLVLDASEGSVLHRFEGPWIGGQRNDRRIAIAPDTCDVDPSACRRLVVLSPDQTSIDEDIDDSAATPGAPWPYGEARERHDILDLDDGVPIYWRHFDPTGLDLPCLVHTANGRLRCR